ncbi:LacI family DNA-binding transcriptional regulator [Yinghuangia soli]|uniref:LacI family transcriptional regulator n=1 Tax=Yinghuangia soli TaxID=2908204 RepID=A0AA41Q528_9ACTN|nr:LacI family DNA-binding transcriptional regulator [Yinghuangia soli]MCF2531095.1 LacI family transcriptional regulator [Yinghuangia soli]
MTSADVARESGVSRSTVSFVLNDAPNQTISPATREKVLAAAERLGYTPNGPAQALSRGRGSTVLLCLPDFPASATVDELVTEMDRVLAAHDLLLVTHRAGPDRQPALALAAAVAPVAVAGLLPFDGDQVAAFRARGARAVLPGPADPPPPRDDAGRTVGVAQAGHLAGRGHVRIGYVHPADSRLVSMSERRLAGVDQTALSLGLAGVSVRRMPADGDFTPVLRGWLAEDAPTAVAAFNDEVAMAVLQAAWASDVVVPVDLAVIGADDIPAARYTCPALTTIRSSGKPFGAMLAHWVLQRLGTGGAARPTADEPPVWTPDIVIRASS